MCVMSNAARDTCSSRGQNFYQFVAVSPVCYLGSGAVPGRNARVYLRNVHAGRDRREPPFADRADICKRFEFFQNAWIRSHNAHLVSLTNRGPSYLRSDGQLWWAQNGLRNLRTCLPLLVAGSPTSAVLSIWPATVPPFSEVL